METTSLASTKIITDADIKLVSSCAVSKDLNFLFHSTNQLSLKFPVLTEMTPIFRSTPTTKKLPPSYATKSSTHRL